MAAVVLVVWGLGRRLLTVPQAVHAGHPAFAVFVLCLGLVVAALAVGPLGDAVSDLLPCSTSYAALLVIAVIATLLANLLTNLSATILLVPLLAPLGTPAILAALLGLNIGSGLTYTGSLANLLWRAGRSGGTASDPACWSSTASHCWSRRSRCSARSAPWLWSPTELQFASEIG